MKGEWGRSALHPIETLDIKPKVARQLRKIGLGTLEELASLHGSQLANIGKIIDGLDEHQLTTNLLPQAWFHLLGDDGALVATRLIKSGVNNYLKLIATPTTQIAKTLGVGWDINRVAQLQLLAARASACFQVLLHIIDTKGKPVISQLQVAGAAFDPGRRLVTHIGDKDGWVLSPRLRRNRAHHLSIVTKGKRWSMHVRPTTSLFRRMTVHLNRALKDGLDESVLPVRTRILSGHETLVVEKKQLSDLPINTVLRVARIDGNKAVLLGIFRRIVGNSVVTCHVDVDIVTLPKRVKPGSIVVIEKKGHIRLASRKEKLNIRVARGIQLGRRHR